MHPSFDLGFTQLPAYFTLLMVGFTLAILWAHAEGERRGLKGNTILDLGLLMLVCGLVGARILHVNATAYGGGVAEVAIPPGPLGSVVQSIDKSIKIKTDISGCNVLAIPQDGYAWLKPHGG